jgi:hypothetical protein
MNPMDWYPQDSARYSTSKEAISQIFCAVQRGDTNSAETTMHSEMTGGHYHHKDDVETWDQLNFLVPGRNFQISMSTIRYMPP